MFTFDHCQNERIQDQCAISTLQSAGRKISVELTEKYSDAYFEICRNCFSSKKLFKKLSKRFAGMLIFSITFLEVVEAKSENNRKDKIFRFRT